MPPEGETAYEKDPLALGCGGFLEFLLTFTLSVVIWPLPLCLYSDPERCLESRRHFDNPGAASLEAFPCIKIGSSQF